ncbi:unnamed protein product [Allacma fusca]|uniref:Uncharacterized protein n=1 Tax=Allacma fusca TaxID=39272 RepID=A0A8J2LYL6_9HEXA|nr:unnamed protein product [Allacma fusca]
MSICLNCTRRGKGKSKEALLDEAKLWKNVSSRHCEGHATRHHLCNTQECPKDSIDFRESQCKAFDNRPFTGKVYQWEAFIDEARLVRYLNLPQNYVRQRISGACRLAILTISPQPTEYFVPSDIVI